MERSSSFPVLMDGAEEFEHIHFDDPDSVNPALADMILAVVMNVRSISVAEVDPQNRRVFVLFVFRKPSGIDIGGDRPSVVERKMVTLTRGAVQSGSSVPKILRDRYVVLIMEQKRPLELPRDRTVPGRWA